MGVYGRVYGGCEGCMGYVFVYGWGGWVGWGMLDEYE